jgi:hypothetical protein
MANNNVQNVKFLRNGVVFVPGNDKTARQVALDAMELQKANLDDGTAILGRYQETNGIVKTLVGFAYISGDTKTLTVFDVDGAGADVDAKIAAAINALDAEKTSTDGTNVQVKVTEVDGKITAVNITTDNTVNSSDVDTAITNAINELDYTDAAVNGQYVSQVSEADGKIAVVRVDLPSLTEVKETGKPIVAVSENKGQVAASVGTINAEFVNIADSGSLITATTVEGALAEIAAEIDAMDKPASAEDGKVVTTVSESDGVVSETKANVKDLQLGGYTKDTTATGDIASGDTINAALSKLENKAAAITIRNADGSINVTTGASGTDVAVHIKTGEKVLAKDGNNGLYTNISLSSITPTSTAVKEEYQLTATDGTKLGDTIKIYKDSSIVEIYLGTNGDSVDATTGVITKLDGDKQYLNYVYFKADGTYEMTKINISVFITEQEFASGVTFDSTENKVKGVVDPASENFLTVGADGFKLAGVQDAINTAISGLDATVGSTTIATGKHVAVEVVEVNGVLTTLTVTENNIADADDLTQEIADREAGDTALSNRLGDGVTSTNTAAAQLAALSGNSSTDTSATTSVEGAKKYAKQYADEKVAAAVDGLDATVSGETADGKVNVKVTEADGVITAVDVAGTDIASASALTAEIAARKAVDGQDGQTYAANTSANYISAATSLNDADVKLDAALKTADDAMLTGVAAGDGITVTAKANKSQTISAKVNGDNGILNDATGLHLGTIDCGTY